MDTDVPSGKNVLTVRITHNAILRTAPELLSPSSLGLYAGWLLVHAYRQPIGRIGHGHDHACLDLDHYPFLINLT